MPRALVLRPYAKINLTLHVGEARPDGFHEVRTLVQSIGVCDRLTFETRRGAFALVCRRRGVPTDRSNLVWRAAEAVWRAMGRQGDPAGARVTLEKRIPVAAGLGGGSADAAAALVGLNALWRARLSRDTLAAIAGRLGSDVPFFLLGGTAEAAGRGETLSPADDIAAHAVVILMPAFGVSAADAYRWLDEDRAAHLPSSGESEPPVDLGWPRGAVRLVNDLEAPVGRRHPPIRQMVAACRRAGAFAAAMTGSGSAVFGLFRRRPGQTVLARLRRGPWRVIVTRTLTRRDASRTISV